MRLFGLSATAVRKEIAALDLKDYSKKARELFKLKKTEVLAAELDYRHFLFLVYWNRKKRNELPVVPTKRADMIWHAHLLFNEEYNQFCEKLFGGIIPHRPGLEEGSAPFLRAVRHTRQLHLAVADGFVSDYFSHVVVHDSKPVKADQESTPKKAKRSQSGDGGATTAGASCGASCGSGCGSGCGAGCGAG